MNEPDGSIVFLCGAGLSMDAGLPSSTELVDRLYVHLEELRRNAQETEGEKLLAVLNFLVGGIRFQQGVLCQDPRQPINIEQIANAALRLAKRHQNPLAPYISGWHQRVDELESSSPAILDRFVETTYSRLAIELTPKPDADLTYLYRFKDFLDLSPHLDIFSLNYDLCVETVFAQRASMIVNGFGENGWDPTQLRKKGGMRLLKLHGSLDWLDHEEYGICSVDYPRHHTLTRADLPRPPLLIFGTDQKTTGLDPFLTLLYHFSEAIDRARLLVTVGYSFADEYINEIIQQRMATNPRLRIVVVAPDAGDSVDRVDWLRRRPLIVSHIDSTARNAMQNMSLRDHAAEILDDQADAPPF